MKEQEYVRNAILCVRERIYNERKNGNRACFQGEGLGTGSSRQEIWVLCNVFPFERPAFKKKKKNPCVIFLLYKK